MANKGNQDHQIQQEIPGSYGSKECNNNNNNCGPYDLGELDQALFLYLEGHDHPSNVETRQSSGIRNPTLNIFPSQPMHVEPSPKELSLVSAENRVESKVSSSQYRNLASKGTVQLGFDTNSTTVSKRTSEQSMELENHRNDLTVGAGEKDIKRQGNRKGPTSSSEHEGPKTPDPKTLRRLAQNREAARKSRLRKKAYVQQLESSRIKLTQLEQELQRARTQGVLLGGTLLGDQGLSNGNLSSDAAVFDMEYARWLEEQHRITCDLRAAVQEHLPENDLRLFVDNCLAHYNEIMGLKSIVVKSDVFHLVFGIWRTPAERCFMWMGGFRPSDLIKVILPHIEPLSEQQFLAIVSLQQSTQQGEEALTQGMEALNQSVSETIASGSLTSPSNMANYMGQMASAINKLSNLEGFVRQADNLRHQTLQQLHRILTTRQAARCFIAIDEYFHRLRALSSLWLTRPKQE